MSRPFLSSHHARFASRVCSASYYRQERPISIVRPVLMRPSKSTDNSQGKCGRYKVKLRPFAHWSNVFVAFSHVFCNQMRRRIVVIPNDNSRVNQVVSKASP